MFWRTRSTSVEAAAPIRGFLEAPMASLMRTPAAPASERSLYAHTGRMANHDGIESPGPMPMTKTVLIVEDNELNMKLFHDILDAQGYATLQTKDGRV